MSKKDEELRVGVIGNQPDRPHLEAITEVMEQNDLPIEDKKLDLEAMFSEATDDAQEYTQQDLANVMYRLQRRWNCSPSTVRHRILSNATRTKRPRKPAPRGRAALVERQKKQRN